MSREIESSVSELKKAPRETEETVRNLANRPSLKNDPKFREQLEKEQTTTDKELSDAEKVGKPAQSLSKEKISNTINDSFSRKMQEFKNTVERVEVKSGDSEMISESYFLDVCQHFYDEIQSNGTLNDSEKSNFIMQLTQLITQKTNKLSRTITSERPNSVLARRIETETMNDLVRFAEENPKLNLKQHLPGSVKNNLDMSDREYIKKALKEKYADLSEAELEKYTEIGLEKMKQWFQEVYESLPFPPKYMQEMRKVGLNIFKGERADKVTLDKTTGKELKRQPFNQTGTSITDLRSRVDFDFRYLLNFLGLGSSPPLRPKEAQTLPIKKTENSKIIRKSQTEGMDSIERGKTDLIFVDGASIFSESLFKEIVYHEMIHAYCNYIRAKERKSWNIDKLDREGKTFYSKIWNIIKNLKGTGINDAVKVAEDEKFAFKNEYLRFRKESMQPVHDIFDGGFPFDEVVTVVGEAFAPMHNERKVALANVVYDQKGNIKNQTMYDLITLFQEYQTVPKTALNDLKNIVLQNNTNRKLRSAA